MKNKKLYLFDCYFLNLEVNLKIVKKLNFIKKNSILVKPSHPDGWVKVYASLA